MSALPVVGDAIGAFAKAEKSCKIITAFHKAGSIGNIGAGTYSFGKIAKKYISGDASYSAEEILGDLSEVAMTGVSMFGSAKDFGTSYCFVAGTLVTTEYGFKPIEEIEVGDRVLSENELTGEVAVKKVTKTFVNETNELIHIHVNGEEIVATPTHPFYVYKFGWSTARALRAGDVLVLSNGEHVVVEWIDHEFTEQPVYVYNFEVEDFHTYFVGESGILVHNGEFNGVKTCGSSSNIDNHSKNEPDSVTVGRWMSEDEYNRMLSTGKVQPGLEPGFEYKHKDVAYPSDPNAFGRQAPKGSVYVEFDVPSDRIKEKGSGWARVIGPDSYENILRKRRGENAFTDFPNATNIRKSGSK